MKKIRFTDEQIVNILREATRDGVPDTSRKYKVSDVTIYAWRKKFAGMDQSQVADLKRLNTENTRLKKLLAERDLVIEVRRRSPQKSGRRACKASGCTAGT